jgi:hypothetical protein
VNGRDGLRQTAQQLRRDYRDLLAGPPRSRGTEAQKRAEQLEQARERITARRRDEPPQLRLTLDG